jgi:hypothetical protein
LLGDAAVYGVCVPCKFWRRRAAVAVVRKHVRARLQRRRAVVRVGSASSVCCMPSARGDGRCSCGRVAPQGSGSGGSLRGRGGRGASCGSSKLTHLPERWRGANLVVGQGVVVKILLVSYMQRLKTSSRGLG